MLGMMNQYQSGGAHQDLGLHRYNANTNTNTTHLPTSILWQTSTPHLRVNLGRKDMCQKKSQLAADFVLKCWNGAIHNHFLQPLFTGKKTQTQMHMPNYQIHLPTFQLHLSKHQIHLPKFQILQHLALHQIGDNHFLVTSRGLLSCQMLLSCQIIQQHLVKKVAR